MHIGIIGLGETGATILALLNQKFSNTTFHIYDPAEWIEGRLLDLHHASVYRGNQLKLNDFESSKECSYFFFCAGTRNAKDGDRMDMVRQNKSIISDVFKNINPNEKSKIIVLTNPVELISEWIYEHLNEKIVVLGTGTGLDAYRLKYLISKHLSIDSNLVDVPVVGEHGANMLPLFSVGKIKGVDAEKVLTPKEREEITIELKSAAKKIRKTEEATKYGVAQCAVDIMECFEKEESSVRYVSYKLPEKLFQSLELKYPIFLSIPCFIGQNDIIDNWLYDFSLKEHNQLIETAKKIEAFYKDFSVI